MLYDARVSAASNKQYVAAVVAHELAHQWFGNLVTPRWWTDLWLNEGFASYVEYIGVNHVSNNPYRSLSLNHRAVYTRNLFLFTVHDSC